MSWNLQSVFFYSPSGRANPYPDHRNPFPHTTFNWIGLDGSQILTHMTPVVNYNSPVSFSDILKGYRNHHNLDVTSEAMILFGNGDGGAGPTWEMLERLKRARAVGVENDPKGMELPLVKRGGSMGGFFDRVRKESGGGERLASWWGELYLEIHRGSFFSGSCSTPYPMLVVSHYFTLTTYTHNLLSTFPLSRASCYPLVTTYI